jgi:hypothetical protein
MIEVVVGSKHDTVSERERPRRVGAADRRA